MLLFHILGSPGGGWAPLARQKYWQIRTDFIHDNNNNKNNNNNNLKLDREDYSKNQLESASVSYLPNVFVVLGDLKVAERRYPGFSTEVLIAGIFDVQEGAYEVFHDKMASG